MELHPLVDLTPDFFLDGVAERRSDDGPAN